MVSERTRPAQWASKLSLFIGPCLLGLLLWKTDLSALERTLKDTDLLWFAAAVGGWLVNGLIKAIRWRLILNAQRIALSVRDAIRWYLAALFLGGVSPGRLGELWKVKHLLHQGHPLGRSLFSTIMDRMYDLLILPVMACVGMVLYGGLLSEELWILVLGLLGLLLTLLVLWKTRHLLAIPIRAMIPHRWKDSLRETGIDLVAEFRGIPVATHVAAGSMTALTWLLYMASVYLLALSIGLEVDPIYLGVMALLAALAGLLPVTVSGLGTRDGVFVLCLGRIGITMAHALALSALVLLLNITLTLFYIAPYVTTLSTPPPPSRRES